MPSAKPSPLKVAVIGGGPGGLGVLIALSALPNVSVKLYEQARELREIGAGITIGYNCWRVLELLGADIYVKGDLKTEVLQRNGVTGEVLATRGISKLPPKYETQRVRRSNLQAALLKRVPKGTIELRKRLISMENLDNGEVKLKFEDEMETDVDLVVGADGVRSIVRQHLFPDHVIKFTGTTIWRTLIPAISVAHIPGITPDASWWHGPRGFILFTIVDSENVEEKDRLMEITANIMVNPATATGKQWSWGVPATNERVLSHFTEYDSRAQEALKQVPEGGWKEFSAFAGPRLDSLMGWDKVVLVGDASHPLAGGLGSGASFALEDSWILAQAIKKTQNGPNSISEALKIFNSIRSPYYSRMYLHLAEQKAKVVAAKMADPENSFENSLRVRVPAFSRGEDLAWINQNDIERVWERYLETVA